MAFGSFSLFRGSIATIVGARGLRTIAWYALPQVLRPKRAFCPTCKLHTKRTDEVISWTEFVLNSTAEKQVCDSLPGLCPVHANLGIGLFFRQATSQHLVQLCTVKAVVRPFGEMLSRFKIESENYRS